MEQFLTKTQINPCFELKVIEDLSSIYQLHESKYLNSLFYHNGRVYIIKDNSYIITPILYTNNDSDNDNGQVVCSSVYNTIGYDNSKYTWDYRPYHVFNRKIGHYNGDCWISLSGTYTGYIGYIFKKKKYCLTSFQMFGRCPTQFNSTYDKIGAGIYVVEGYNSDDETWEIIYENNKNQDSLYLGLTSPRYYIPDEYNNKFYNGFRIRFTNTSRPNSANGTGTYLCLGCLNFYGHAENELDKFLTYEYICDYNEVPIYLNSHDLIPALTTTDNALGTATSLSIDVSEIPDNKCFASSQYNGTDYSIDKSFNKVNATGTNNNYWITISSAGKDSFIGYKFSETNKKILLKYKVQPPYCHNWVCAAPSSAGNYENVVFQAYTLPKTWLLQGSNNGEDWVTLHTQDNIEDSLLNFYSTEDNKKESPWYIIDKDLAVGEDKDDPGYIYFRLLATDNSKYQDYVPTGYLGFGEIYFYGLTPEEYIKYSDKSYTEKENINSLIGDLISEEQLDKFKTVLDIKEPKYLKDIELNNIKPHNLNNLYTNLKLDHNYTPNGYIHIFNQEEKSNVWNIDISDIGYNKFNLDIFDENGDNIIGDWKYNPDERIITISFKEGLEYKGKCYIFFTTHEYYESENTL